jgi:hypothetical protein
MAGPGSTFTGPLISGPIWNSGDARGPVNAAPAVLAQRVTLTQNGATAVTGIINVPDGSWLHSVYIDTTVAWNAGTTNPLTIGLTAGGTDFLSGTALTSVGRIIPTTYTSAQLVAMQQVGTGTTNGIPIFFTVTPTGTAATTGTTIVTLLYIQTVQLLAGDA